MVKIVKGISQREIVRLAEEHHNITLSVYDCTRPDEPWLERYRYLSVNGKCLYRRFFGAKKRLASCFSRGSSDDTLKSVVRKMFRYDSCYYLEVRQIKVGRKVIVKVREE